MNWYCVYKSQEEGYILTEIPQQRVFTGNEFQTCDLPTQIFFDLEPYILYRIWPFSWLHMVGPRTLGDRFAAVASKQYGTQSRLSQSLYTLKEFAAHLPGLHAPATEPSFVFC